MGCPFLYSWVKDDIFLMNLGYSFLLIALTAAAGAQPPGFTKEW